VAERSVRLRYGADLRQRFRLAALPAAALEERRRRLRQMSKRLVAAGKHAEALKALSVGAAAKTDEAFAEVERAVDELVGSAPVRTREPKTFRDVCVLWTSGELHRRYPDRVAAKITAKQDRARAAVLCETIGDVQLRRFTVETAERALSKLPRKLARGTRRQYAQIIGRVLRLAVFPLRVIEHSPLPDGWVPRGSTQRAFSFLYPSEDAQLMKCVEIELELRLLYGLLAREGLRISEALRMTWDTVDTTVGVVRLDRNKTRHPRAWRLGADVCRALQRWGAMSRRGQSNTVFHASIAKIASIGAARQFRRDLELAGIKRPELYERSAERSPIRVHDLRATFITLALADGKSETWVMDRTGHTTSNMVNGYRRQARLASELELGWLGPLDELLGLGRVPRKTAGKSSHPRALQRTTSSNERPPLRRKTAETAAPETLSVSSRLTGPAGFDDPGQVERALTESLRAATAAGEWAAVAELARELGERRRERANPSQAPSSAKRTRQR
jgi:integrase